MNAINKHILTISIGISSFLYSGLIIGQNNISSSSKFDNSNLRLKTSQNSSAIQNGGHRLFTSKTTSDKGVDIMNGYLLFEVEDNQSFNSITIDYTYKTLGNEQDNPVIIVYYYDADTEELKDYQVADLPGTNGTYNIRINSPINADEIIRVGVSSSVNFQEGSEMIIKDLKLENAITNSKMMANGSGSDNYNSVSKPGSLEVNAVRSVNKINFSVSTETAGSILVQSESVILESYIINATGQILHSRKNIESPRFNLDVKNVPGGIYFMKVIDNAGGYGVERIVIP